MAIYAHDNQSLALENILVDQTEWFKLIDPNNWDKKREIFGLAILNYEELIKPF